MKFFIDTANIDEIKEAASIGILDGVTTNPTLISREKGHPTDIFLANPAITFICPICHDVLKDASSFRECGHTFCERCIEECSAVAASCPTCRKPVQTGSTPNYSLRDIIGSLEVRCPERGNSIGNTCNWKGNVNDLNQHLDICDFVYNEIV